MSKIVSNNKQKLLSGLNLVADAVKITIGPRGRNVIIESGLHPIIANDGGRIAKEINLKDGLENLGAQVVKGVVQKTSDEVGGGRTASAILTQALVNEGMAVVKPGFNLNDFKKGMKMACDDIGKKLDEMSKPVKGKMLEQVATISTENEELGKVIADTISKVGKDGVVTVEESSTQETKVEIADGLKFERGWISPFMVMDRERKEVELKDSPVLIYNKKLTNFGELEPLLDGLLKKGIKSLFIIAEDIDEQVLKVFAFAKFQTGFNIVAIKTPGVGDNKKFTLEDLSALTGADIADEITPSIKLGLLKKVVCGEKTTTIIGSKSVKSHIETLKAQRANTENKWEIDQYDERIAKLSNGVAVIKVGASSDEEIKYLKLKIEDGVNETKRALEEGVVIGGNCAYIHAVKQLEKQSLINEAGIGYNLVLKAVEAPLRQIIENGDGNTEDIDKIYTSKNLTTGYNSLENKVVDNMFDIGVIDAVKVPKTILKNAVSSASMFLSTGYAIVEEKDGQTN